MVIPQSFINIGVWNIHGLFQSINKLKLCKLEDEEIQKRVQDFDIFCFQETQCGTNDIKQSWMPDYRIFPFERNISANNRYFGGSLILIKKKIKEGVKIIENSNSDKIWIKILKNFFNLKKDIYFCFSYAPPLNSPYTKNLDFDVLQNLEVDIGRFKQEGNVLVGGDFNAKTSTALDFVLDQDDKHSPIMDIPNYVSDDPLRRENCDKHSVDKQGETLLNLCKNSRMRILNGRTKGDRYGRYTRFPLAIRESPSTLDYAIADIEIMNEVASFLVLSNLGLSDHECLSVSIKSQGFFPPVVTPILVSKKTPFRKIDTNKFLLKLNSPLGREKCANFLTKHKNSDELDDMTEDLVDLINFASVNHVHNRKNKKRNRGDRKNPWYTIECRKLKGCLNRAVKRYRVDPLNRGLQEEVFSAKKNFKKICRDSENKLRKN